MNLIALKSLCPVCGQPLESRELITETEGDETRILRQQLDCPAGHYDYRFDFGVVSVQIGEQPAKFGCDLAAHPRVVEGFLREIEERAANYRSR